MKQVSREATIEWKINPSYFRSVNAKNLNEPVRRIGSSVKAVNAMLAKGEMLRELMPNIIGVDPNSTSANWHDIVKRYFDSFSVQIASGGKMIETGLIYDVDSDKPYVKEILSKNQKIKTDADLQDWVEDKVSEDLKFRYATPIDPKDYILWVYTWEYRDVANKLEDVDKSKAIRFYVVMKGEQEAIRRNAFIRAEEASDKYRLAVKDSKKIDSMLYLFDQDPEQFDSDIDKRMFLKGQSETNPEGFIKIYEDKALEKKADIERMIKKGVLNRLANTNIIVDANDPDTVLGDTLYEAVAYFNSTAQIKVAKIKEFYTRLNGLNN